MLCASRYILLRLLKDFSENVSLSEFSLGVLILLLYRHSSWHHMYCAWRLNRVYALVHVLCFIYTTASHMDHTAGDESVVYSASTLVRGVQTIVPSAPPSVLGE